ncbi:ATP-binding protein [Thiothrix unzii]|jgi:predicted AAA+ superfamily ATPase|uniref:ATP-binding protein n=1 Tax=Thiothrix unzii TaxID=111769 RepID=UPI002A363841|nr:ATP-binding protein [Thiothrix unzii]MDX9987970.1 ATP-binding protein [Thiothrix unzii]
MIKRNAENSLTKLAVGFPVVSITGPRQSGKTTLAQHCFAEKPYVTLEDPDTRDYALHDPRSFLAQFPDGAILDEIQRCPDLFSYLQGIVDRDGRMGLFILTGSQQFSLKEGISQSLAGRVGMVHLLPLAQDELLAAGDLPTTLDEFLYKGAYPPIYTRPVEAFQWYANYVSTYLERDVRQLINVQDLALFQRFLRVCAHHVGQLVNLTQIANDCGISQKTVEAWLSVLEASYLVVRLQPWYRNFNKRLVKTPKLYFYDTGLVCWLLGIRDVEQVKFHAMRGALFENLVISECHKYLFNQGEHPEIWFWRDRSGHEVDMVLERGGQFRAVEVKSGQTLSQDQFKGLQFWQELTGNAGKALLVYGGEQAQQRTVAQVVPWRNLAGLCDN